MSTFVIAVKFPEQFNWDPDNDCHELERAWNRRIYKYMLSGERKKG